MSNDKANSGPAFPFQGVELTDNPTGPGQVLADVTYPGMSIRQYAAIKLRVPDSGEQWLDEMIKQSLRDEFAGKAMQALISKFPEVRVHANADVMGAEETAALNMMGAVACGAYAYADALLKAREQ